MCGWDFSARRKEELLKIVDDFFDALGNINEGLIEAQKHTPELKIKFLQLSPG